MKKGKGGLLPALSPLFFHFRRKSIYSLPASSTHTHAHRGALTTKIPVNHTNTDSARVQRVYYTRATSNRCDPKPSIYEHIYLHILAVPTLLVNVIYLTVTVLLFVCVCVCVESCASFFVFRCTFGLEVGLVMHYASLS